METKVDLSGKYAFTRMLNSGLVGDPEVKHLRVDGCKLIEDVAMYTQLPDYDDFQRPDSHMEMS